MKDGALEKIYAGLKDIKEEIKYIRENAFNVKKMGKYNKTKKEKEELLEDYRTYLSKSREEVPLYKKQKARRELSRIVNRLNIIDPHWSRNKLSLVFILMTFLFSLFFTSISFTGAVVGTTKNDFSLLGILFFIGGLIVTYVFVKGR